MEIAAVTDEGKTISAHFGRARAYLALQQAGLEPFVTTEASIADAVRACLAGEPVNDTERLH